MSKFPEKIEKHSIHQWLDALVDHLGLRGVTDADEIIKDALVAARNQSYNDLGTPYDRRELPNTDDVARARKGRERNKKGVLMVVRAAEAYARTHDLTAVQADATAASPVLSAPDPTTPARDAQPPQRSSRPRATAPKQRRAPKPTVEAVEVPLAPATATGTNPIAVPETTTAPAVRAGAEIITPCGWTIDECVNQITSEPKTAPILGQMIQQRRIALGMDLATLARDLGITNWTMSQLEHGKPWAPGIDRKRMFDALRWTTAPVDLERLATVALHQPTLREQIGRELHTVLHGQGFTVASLAKTAGRTVQTIESIITGQTRPEDTTISSILNALGNPDSLTRERFAEAHTWETESTNKAGKILESTLAAELLRRERQLLTISPRLRNHEREARRWKTATSPVLERTGIELADAIRGLVTPDESKRMETIGAVIRARREALGFDAKEAARLACVSAGVWALLERGIVPTEAVLRKRQIAWVLYWTPEDLREATSAALSEIGIEPVIGEPESPVMPLATAAPTVPVRLISADANPPATHTGGESLLARAAIEPRVLMPYTAEIVRTFWAAVSARGRSGDNVRDEHFPEMNPSAWRPLVLARPEPPVNRLYGPTLVRLATAIEALTGEPLESAIAAARQPATAGTATVSETASRTAPAASAVTAAPKRAKTGKTTKPNAPIETPTPELTSVQRDTVTALGAKFAQRFTFHNADGAIVETSGEPGATTTVAPVGFDPRLAYVTSAAHLEEFARAFVAQAAGSIREILPTAAQEIEAVDLERLVELALAAAGLQSRTIEGSTEVLLESMTRS